MNQKTRQQNSTKEALLVVGGSIGGLLVIVLGFLLFSKFTREEIPPGDLAVSADQPTPVVQERTDPVLVTPTESPTPPSTVEPEPVKAAPVVEVQPAPVEPAPVVEEAPKPAPESTRERMIRELTVKLYERDKAQNGINHPLPDHMVEAGIALAKAHAERLMAAIERTQAIARRLAPAGKERLYQEAALNAGLSGPVVDTTKYPDTNDMISDAFLQGFLEAEVRVLEEREKVRKLAEERGR